MFNHKNGKARRKEGVRKEEEGRREEEIRVSPKREWWFVLDRSLKKILNEGDTNDIIVKKNKKILDYWLHMLA